MSEVFFSAPASAVERRRGVGGDGADAAMMPHQCAADGHVGGRAVVAVVWQVFAESAPCLSPLTTMTEWS